VEHFLCRNLAAKALVLIEKWTKRSSSRTQIIDQKTGRLSLRIASGRAHLAFTTILKARFQSGGKLKRNAT
jgi:hypothetical protein